MHLPAECRLSMQRKEEQKPTAIVADSATYAAAATSIANPQFQALLANIAGLQGQFNKE
jgi:hypothetical protein